MKTISAALFICVFVSACSNQPKQVSASIPLVNAGVANQHNPIPERYWKLLDEQPAGSVFVHEGQQITLGSEYVSALGHRCRKLLLNTPSNNSAIMDVRRVTCQPNNYRYWYLVPDIMRVSNQSFSFK